jgi:hypothetical protein
MAVRAIEAVFFAFGIKMSSSRLEVRRFALWGLVKVDSVLSGSQVMEVYLERDARALIPDDYIAHDFSLCVFEFYFGLGHALRWESEKEEK